MLQSSKFNSPGVPKCCIEYVHAHTQSDKLSMNYVKLQKTCLKKARALTGAFREGEDLQFKLARLSDGYLQPSQAKEIEEQDEAQIFSFLYGLVVSLSKKAVL